MIGGGSASGIDRVDGSLGTTGIFDRFAARRRPVVLREAVLFFFWGLPVFRPLDETLFVRP
jgi:hypothetical protein